MFAHKLGLRGLVLIAHLGRIAARALALDPGDILHEDRLGTKALDLLLGGRAHIGCRNLRAQTPRSRDRLKARNAHAHDEGLGRLNGASRCHHHRESATICVRRSQHRLVTRQVGLAGEHVHSLRAGDARHEFHRKRLKPGLGVILNAFLIGERVEQGGDHRAVFRAVEQGDVRRLDRQHNISIFDHFGSAADRGARVAKCGIGD